MPAGLQSVVRAREVDWQRRSLFCPGSRRTAADLSVADLPDARRPQRHTVKSPDHRHRCLGSTGRHRRLEGPAGKQARTRHVSPYAAPARAKDLSGLPPAYIDVGELDVFRDEDIEYATRLFWAASRSSSTYTPGRFTAGTPLFPTRWCRNGRTRPEEMRCVAPFTRSPVLVSGASPPIPEPAARR